MKVVIDENLCQGHARCILACPDVFDLDEQGHGIVLVDTVPPEYEIAVKRALGDCPESAISVLH